MAVSMVKSSSVNPAGMAGRSGIGLIVGAIGLLMSYQSEGRYEKKMPIVGMSISFVAILFGGLLYAWKKEALEWH